MQLQVGPAIIIAMLLASGMVESNKHGVLVNKIACRRGPANFDEPGGIITSPLHPRGPPTYVFCTWILQNPHQDYLILSFSVFDLEQDSKCGKKFANCCPHQWLMVKTESHTSKTKDERHSNMKTLYIGNEDKGTSNPEFNMNQTLLSSKKTENESSFEEMKTTGHICGNTVPYPIITTAPRVIIRFYSDTKVKAGHLGFTLQYQISNNMTICSSTEFRCTNPRLCIPQSWQCNGQPECPDSSDESDCQAGCPGVADSQHCDGRWHCLEGQDELGCFGCDADEWWCGEGTDCYKASKRCDGIPDCPNRADEVYCSCFNQTQCGPNSEFCYDPKTQRCDGILHCPNGLDEMDCGGMCRHMIPCSRGGGCYTAAQRCDGASQCGDGSDEGSCTPQLCHPQHGAFLCANRRCIRDAWRCDQFDDCGDASDEEDCLRNSVIVAAAMGGLVCSLLLVIAVGCTCRLYALRIGLDGVRHHGHRGGRRSTPLSPLSRLEHHLLQREPPPSYSVAVNDPSALLFGGSRISRHWRRHRRRPPAPPEGILPLPGSHHGCSVPISSRSRDLPLPHNSARSCFPGVGSGGRRSSRSSDEKESEEEAKSRAPPLPVPSQGQQHLATTSNDDDDVPLLSAIDDSGDGDSLEERDDAQLLDNTSGPESDDSEDEDQDDLEIVTIPNSVVGSDPHQTSNTGNIMEDDDVPSILAEEAVDTADEALLSVFDSDLPFNPDEISQQGDVFTDTRAAVLALSAVQRHTEDFCCTDTELSSQ